MNNFVKNAPCSWRTIKNLRKRYTEISERASKVREEHAASQSSHDKRRHQLDLQVLEIEDLRKALSNQADELNRAEEEKNRISTEKSDISRTVASLEADLKRVKRDAEVFGRDLKLLRQEKERLESEKKEEKSNSERARKQSQTEIRLLKEDLRDHKAQLNSEQERWKVHICAADDQQLIALKQQHKSECKGLIVQIRYLKAKFTRESSLRADLGYQKGYLLMLLASYDRKEQKILAAIAKIGFPSNQPEAKSPARKKSLKTVVQTVIFIRRARLASEEWRQQCASKEAIANALQEVRRQRTSAPSNKGKERALS